MEIDSRLRDLLTEIQKLKDGCTCKSRLVQEFPTDQETNFVVRKTQLPSPVINSSTSPANIIKEEVKNCQSVNGKIGDGHSTQEDMNQEHVFEENVSQEHDKQEDVNQEHVIQEDVNPEHVDKGHASQEVAIKAHVCEENINQEDVNKDIVDKKHFNQEDVIQKEVNKEDVYLEPVKREDLNKNHVNIEDVNKEYVNNADVDKKDVHQENVYQEHVSPFSDELKITINEPTTTCVPNSSLSWKALSGLDNVNDEKYKEETRRRLAAKSKAKAIGWEVVTAKCGHRSKVNRRGYVHIFDPILDEEVKSEIYKRNLPLGLPKTIKSLEYEKVKGGCSPLVAKKDQPLKIYAPAIKKSGLLESRDGTLRDSYSKLREAIVPRRKDFDPGSLAEVDKDYMRKSLGEFSQALYCESF